MLLLTGKLFVFQLLQHLLFSLFPQRLSVVSRDQRAWFEFLILFYQLQVLALSNLLLNHLPLHLFREVSSYLCCTSIFLQAQYPFGSQAFLCKFLPNQDMMWGLCSFFFLTLSKNLRKLNWQTNEFQQMLDKENQDIQKYLIMLLNLNIDDGQQNIELHLAMDYTSQLCSSLWYLGIICICFWTNLLLGRMQVQCEDFLCKFIQSRHILNLYYRHF